MSTFKRLASFLIGILGFIYTDAQKFQIRAVNTGNGTIAVEMRVTNDSTSQIDQSIADISFGIKWKRAYNVDLDTIIGSDYHIEKAGNRLQKDSFDFQAFYANETPFLFPKSWHTNTWIEILRIANTKTGFSTGDFFICETGFDWSTDPNITIGYNDNILIDFTPEIGGAAVGVPIGPTGRLSLTPKSGTSVVEKETCFDALVLDDNALPVSGVEVHFAIAGPNSDANGFATTGANGIARFCYSGKNRGTDQIVASIGNLSDSAIFSWTGEVCNLKLSFQSFHISCNDGSDGSIDLTVHDGSAPFMFNWSNGDTTEDLKGIKAGEYAVTVSDSKGCNADTTIIITETASLHVTPSVSNASCNGNDGSVTLVATGGTAPYTYTLDSVTKNSGVFIGLGAGPYQYTVMDSTGCAVSGEVEVGQAAAFTVQPTIKDASCNANDGSVTLVVSGGTAPFTYTLDSLTKNSGVFTGLGAGTYHYTVKDSTGCSVSDDVRVDQAALFTVKPEVKDASCNANDGSVKLVVTGGSEPYTYTLDSMSNAIGIFTELGAGTYHYTVRDSTGCSVGADVEVGELSSFTVTASYSFPACGGTVARVQLVATGGVSPYTYTLDNKSDTTGVFTDILAGVYVYSVVDARRCMIENTINIVIPSPFGVSSTITDASCSGDSGIVKLTASGGTPPYRYTLGGTTDTTGLFIGLKSGTYGYTVSESTGCIIRGSVEVKQSASFTVEAKVTNASCDHNDGLVELIASRGVPPYKYTIDSETSLDGVFIGLIAGTYIYSVVDSIGCTVTDTLIVATDPMIFYRDSDNDGYGNSADTILGCPAPPGYVELGGDCNVNNPNINPGETEICQNGIDDNCDGFPFNDSLIYRYYIDNDFDGWGNDSLIFETCVFDTAPPGFSSEKGDCNDNDPLINPGAFDICNGIDENCDGLIDNGEGTKYFRDFDDDDYGSTVDSIYACTMPVGYTTVRGDCNDFNRLINPGVSEICNGSDDDCNGIRDDSLVIRPYYRDFDNDGYGSDRYKVLTCVQLEGYSTVGGDCNENDSLINPGAPERCNGIDDNCNGMIDDGIPQDTFYYDFDEDGYGSNKFTIRACAAPPGYLEKNGDCDDYNAAINPNGIEICNRLDDDCDGMRDDSLTQFIFYRDFDNDKFGTAKYTISACVAPNGYVKDAGDCNENDSTIFPGAPEQCNGIDDDCDGIIDDGLPIDTFYYDFDKDGFGSKRFIIIACKAPPGYINVSGDCNDYDASVYPGVGNCPALNSVVKTKSNMRNGVIQNADNLTIAVQPNPTREYFTLEIQSSDNTSLQLKVVDAVGRSIESRKVHAGEDIRLGYTYGPGMYYVYVIQGKQGKVLKLVKQSY